MGIFQRRVHTATESATVERSRVGWQFTLPTDPIPSSDLMQGAGAGLDLQALAIPTLYKCAEMASSKIGKFKPYAERNGTRREHPILRRPDPHISRYEFLRDTVSSMIHRGDAYWLITSRDTHGRPNTVELMNPDMVSMRWADSRRKRRRFNVVGYGEYGDDEVIVIPAYRPPGALHGLGPVAAARVQWEGQLAADKLARSAFQDGVYPSGVVKAATGLTEAQALAIKEKFMERHAGSRAPIVLTGGAEFDALGVAAKDAQWIESRQWTALDVARAFGMPAAHIDLPVGGTNLTYQNPADVRLNYVHVGLDGMMCNIGAGFERLLPMFHEVEWDLGNYVPDIGQGAEQADEPADPVPAPIQEPAQ